MNSHVLPVISARRDSERGWLSAGWRRGAAVGSAAALVAGLMLATSVAATGAVAQSNIVVPVTTLVADTFAGAAATSADWKVVAGSTACLTAGSRPLQVPMPGCGAAARDAIGNGALRLTGNKANQIGTIFDTISAPTAKGLDIVFNAYQWAAGNSIGADGISFILAATDPTNPALPVVTGPPGQGLGYSASGTRPGVDNGYLGFGFDAYGNFRAGGTGGTGCQDNYGRAPQNVTVRGPGNGLAGYCIAGTSVIAKGSLDAPKATLRPGAVPVEVAINADPAAVTTRNGLVVPGRSWAMTWTPLAGTRTTMTHTLPTAAMLKAVRYPDGYYNPTTGVPYQLTFGWSASSGGLTENHDIAGVVVTTLAGKVPALGVALTDDHSDVFQAGTGATVTVQPSLLVNQGSETQPVSITTTFPAAVIPGLVSAPSLGYGCLTQGQTVSCTYLPLTPIGPGQVLPGLEIPVSVGSGPLGSAAIVAKVSSSDTKLVATTRTISVTAGPVSLMTISPAAKSIVAGGNQVFTTSGVDKFGNSVGDITAHTTFTSSDRSDVITGASIKFGTVGSHTVTATDGLISATATVTVTVGPLATMTVSPAMTSVSAGGSQAFTASGADSFGNSLGDVTGNTRFSSPEVTDTVTGASIKFVKAGSHPVTATDGLISATATVMVTAGPLATLTVLPARTSMVAGSSPAFTASGADSSGNSLGDVTGSTTFSSPDRSDVVTGASIKFVNAGSHTVTATDGLISATATVMVTAGPLAAMTVSPATKSMVAGGSQVFATAGADSFGNPLGDETATTTFSSSDRTDTVTGTSIKFGTVGSHTVTATHGSFTATTTVTVTAGPLATMTVVPARTSMVAGSSPAFTASGADSSGNSLGDVTGSTTFSSPDRSDVVTGASIKFVNAGSHTVTATDGLISATATVMVTAGPLAAMTVSPATKSMVAGGSQVFATAGADSFGNPLGDETATTTFSSSDRTDTVTGTSIKFGTVGSHTVTATDGLATATATVTVAAGSLTSLTVSPATKTVTTGGSQVFTAAGVDSFGNPLGDVTGSTGFTSPDATDTVTANSIKFTTIGSRTITATDGSATGTATVVVTSSSSYLAWGNGQNGQLGDNYTNTDTETDGDYHSKTPVTITGLTDVVAFAGGDTNGYALKSDGTVWAWGSNTAGQLGIGNTLDSHVPVQIPGLTNVAAIAGGTGNNDGTGDGYAVKKDGTVWAWGDNTYGQLGDTSSRRTSPAQILGVGDVKAIAAGWGVVYVLKNDGTVWSWGFNNFGQLGNGTTTAYSTNFSDSIPRNSTPVQVRGLTGVTAIANTDINGYALKSDGTVWAWGGNGNCELGNSNYDCPNVDSGAASNVPVQVMGLTGITAIRGGTYTGYAIKADGTAWAWGGNYYGELGDSTTIDRKYAVQIAGLSGVIAITGGLMDGYAVESDGSLWSWGSDYAGGLGDGGVDRSSPAKVISLTKVTATIGAAGESMYIATK